jgi:hypothetical protein
MTPDRPSVAVLPPEALVVEGALEAIAAALHDAGLRIAAATFASGSAPLFDFVYAQNTPRENTSRNSRVATAFLSVRELDGPVALLLVAGPGDVHGTLQRIKGSSAPGAARPDQLRGCAALTTHRFSFVHVPDLDEPVAEHFFGIRLSREPAPPGDVAEMLADLVSRHRAPLTATTEPARLVEDVVAFCSGHGDLLASLPGSWRREACRTLARSIASWPREPLAIACLDELHADLPVALTATRYHALRAHLAIPAAATSTERP